MVPFRNPSLRARALLASRCVLFLIFLAANASEVQAACHVVTPTGSGTKSGADWNNAFAGLPDPLVRGDTYYLADGTYSTYIFQTSNSGTTVITIKKAIGSDHCTDTGFNLATMGSGQAVFTGDSFGTPFRADTGFLTLDGQVRTSLSSGYGIKMNGSTCIQTFCRGLQIGAVGPVSNVTVQFVEIVGGGATDTVNMAHPDENIFISGSSNITLRSLFIHDSSDAPVLVTGTGTSNLTFEYSYIRLNDSSPLNHGEGMSFSGGSNVLIRYNVFQDIEGTAFISALNAGTAITMDRWTIYGNVFAYSPGNPTGRKGVGDGIVACINGNTCSNWTIANNTIANVGGNSATGNVGIIWDNGSPGTPTIQDNFWFGNQLNVSFALNSGSIEDFNTFLNNAGTCCGAGSHDFVQASGATDPFFNDTAIPPNFGLTSDTVNPHMNDGLTLSSSIPSGCTAGVNCLNIDPTAKVRGASGSWDRGAFQFLRPNSPQNLRLGP